MENFPSGSLEFDFYATPNATGYFEVEVNGKLVHSKKNGDGYVNSEAKVENIVAAIKATM